ncbi:pax3- and pax7-binding protein 1 [Plakobranchus ocellatus]|uniref:Pax3- and pax7-binding protein 1 n=1 Tax=Plakobranchus ocellatus TaxID=259542 RepID=A0AAV4AZB0_9GAST|nr:pax3- and pax7-binding protein 1 [Plakobranchus ocellatus]
MASMFRKPKRNFRKKETDFENENDDEVGTESMEIDVEQSIQPKTDKEKKKKHKSKDKDSKSKSVLSFEMEEDEGDTEVFKIKRSSHSRRIAKQMKKELKEKDSAKNTDREIVKKDEPNENESEIRTERRKKDISEEEALAAAEKIRKLREEFKTLNGEDAIDSSGSDEDEKKAFKVKLARGEIPDAKTIHFIRKQRQMARETDNFIPVDDSQASSNKTSTARLVRDDDNDKSDDDEEDRVDFSVNQAARERQEMRDKFLATEHGSDEDSDQEREWENQQIRKAVSVQVPNMDIPGITDTDSNSQVAFLNSASDAKASTNNGFTNEKKPFSSLAKPQDLTDITIESVRKQLQERLDMADSVHRTHKLELDRVVSDITDTTESIELCEQKAPDLENRYRFFQELRGYVRDLVECLNEKVPIINDLENRINSLLKTRAERLVKRRQQDIQDQCRDYMTNTASIKMDSEASEEQMRQRRAAEREARRARRRRAREAKNISGHYDGLSSDDEDSSQSLVIKFENEIESISKAQRSLFEDVVEEFSSPESVKDNFEKWKFTYGDTYREAYIGLCMPKLLNPFIRADLILWNPLDANNKDFEESGWYDTLIFMGFRDGEKIDRTDDDLKILPSVVDKLIIPKLTFLVQDVWDPLSTTQTARLVNLTMKLTRDYPSINADSKNFRAFMEAVVARLKKTLDDDVFMPMYPLNVLDNRSSGPAIFFHRQSWSCIKLLGNMLSWHQLISPSVLQKLTLSGLLNRYVVIGLASSHINREALHKCQAIISALPKAWFASLEGDSTLPQLENMCRYLVSAAKTLHQATALERDVERLEGRDLVKQISKHLINIHAMDHAVALANEYSFKI